MAGHLAAGLEVVKRIAILPAVCDDVVYDVHLDAARGRYIDRRAVVAVIQACGLPTPRLPRQPMREPESHSDDDQQRRRCLSITVSAANTRTSIIIQTRRTANCVATSMNDNATAVSLQYSTSITIVAVVNSAPDSMTVNIAVSYLFGGRGPDDMARATLRPMYHRRPAMARVMPTLMARSRLQPANAELRTAVEVMSAPGRESWKAEKRADPGDVWVSEMRVGGCGRGGRYLFGRLR